HPLGNIRIIGGAILVPQHVRIGQFRRFAPRQPPVTAAAAGYVLILIDRSGVHVTPVPVGRSTSGRERANHLIVQRGGVRSGLVQAVVVGQQDQLLSIELGVGLQRQQKAVLIVGVVGWVECSVHVEAHFVSVVC